MQHFDFLSLPPSIFLMKERKGKNKLGGLFSILFALVMLFLSIYHFYIYISSSEFDLTYYRDNWLTKLSKEEKKYIREPKLLGIVFNYLSNDVKIKLRLTDGENDFTDFERCNYNLESDPNGDLYCFNLYFYHLDQDKIRALLISCEENCVDPDGNPARISFGIFTRNLKIDHQSKNPYLQEDLYGDNFYVATDTKKYVNHMFEFTPIIYNSSEVFSTKSYEYINTYLNSVQRISVFSNSDNTFFAFNLIMNTHCDIYIRKYKTFLDTLATIGGLFTPFKLFFDLLIMFYSESENNSEITKNVLMKTEKYEYDLRNKISLEKELDKEVPNKENASSEQLHFDIEIPEKEKIKRKEFNINKCEKYFYCFSSCCKKNKTMKILNLCNDFVQNYLSVENIIFNMVLFENFYKDNPIKFKENLYLNQIKQEIEPDSSEAHNTLEEKLNNI